MITKKLTSLLEQSNRLNTILMTGSTNDVQQFLTRTKERQY